MRPQEVFIFRILPVAGLSTALLLFSVHHLLNANNAGSTATRYRLAAALAQQDLRMPSEPLAAASSRPADAGPAQAARPWPQPPELGKRNYDYDQRTGGKQAVPQIGDETTTVRSGKSAALRCVRRYICSPQERRIVVCRNRFPTQAR